MNFDVKNKRITGNLILRIKFWWNFDVKNASVFGAFVARIYYLVEL